MNPQEKFRDTSAQQQLHSVPPGPAGEEPFPVWPPPESTDEIKIGKAVVLKETDSSAVAEVFTMTLGNETIQLLPLKHWTQLDTYKWRARGILPHTPAGLEITWEHVKVGGETVSPWDADACAKLEKAFNNWLALEKQSLEAAKEKAQALTSPAPLSRPQDETVHFAIEMGPLGQPRIKCLEGRQEVKVVALNQQGLNALIEQGLMRKPGSFKVGALHDWVELDGVLFRFKEGTDWAREVERFLNERYVVVGETDAPGDVAVFANPASPTGFDLQFTASPTGFIENRKRHLNEETIELLNDTERCHVLRRGIIAKLAAPNLVFKLKTADGGECYLEPGPETTACATGEDGQEKTVDLSQPVDLLKVGVPELKAVFNHPAINRRARLAQMGENKAED